MLSAADVCRNFHVVADGLRACAEDPTRSFAGRRQCALYWPFLDEMAARPALGQRLAALDVVDDDLWLDAAKLTAEQRSEIARKAARKRWQDKIG